METLIAADLRGNGHLDLVASNGTVLLNNRSGTFAAATVGFLVTVANSSYGPNLVAADFNKDGKVDVAVSGGTSMNVYLGNGDGTFITAGRLRFDRQVSATSQPRISMATVTSTCMSVSPTAASSVVISSAPTRPMRSWARAMATFMGAPSLPFAYSGTNVADVNGDGVPDAVGVNADRSLTAYLGDAAGHSRPPPRSPRRP